MWLFLLFVTIPLIEIGLFIQVGGWLGLWPTLGIVVLTAILGTFLVRAQGLMALSQIQSNLRDLRDPTESIAHGAMILASGLLLLTPGFFTDAVGFALLVPPFRLAIFNAVRSRIKVQSFVHGDTSMRGQQRPTQDQDNTIDGEFQEIDPDAPQPTHRPSSGWTRH